MRGPEIPGSRDWHASFVYPFSKQDSILSMLPRYVTRAYTYTHTYFLFVCAKIKLKDMHVY